MDKTIEDSFRVSRQSGVQPPLAGDVPLCREHERGLEGTIQRPRHESPEGMDPATNPHAEV